MQTGCPLITMMTPGRSGTEIAEQDDDLTVRPQAHQALMTYRLFVQADRAWYCSVHCWLGLVAVFMHSWKASVSALHLEYMWKAIACSWWWGSSTSGAAAAGVLIVLTRLMSGSG